MKLPPAKEKSREITQRIFDEVSDHLTWEQSKECVRIFVEEFMKISTIQMSESDKNISIDDYLKNIEEELENI
jgi:hypothetical protein